MQTNQLDQSNQSLLTEEEQRLLDMIKEYPDMTNILLAQTLGWSVSRVKYYVQRLKNQERLKEKECVMGFKRLLERKWKINFVVEHERANNNE